MDSNEKTTDQPNLPERRKSIMNFTRRELLIGIFCLTLLGVMYFHYFFIFGPHFDEALNNFEIELVQIENELDDNFEQYSQLKDETAKFSAQIVQLKSELATKDEQIALMKSGSNTKSERIAELETELATSREQIAQLEIESSAKSDQIVQLEIERTSSEEQISQFKSESPAKTERIAQLEDELATIREQIAKLEKESSAKSDQIAQLENELKEKFNQISLLELETLAKSDLIAQLEMESSANSDQITQLENELKEKFNQISLLELETLAKSDVIVQMETESSDKSNEIARLNIEIRKQLNQIEELQKLINIPVVDVSEWPPFISLSEASNYSFEIGKATLSPDLENFLIKSVAGQIRSFVENDDAEIVEVIGHTDDLPIVRGTTTFDHDIINALEGSFPIEELYPTDNAGLGIARAVSVINVLQKIDGLSNLTYVPLSGGQLIKPEIEGDDSNLSGDSKVRRRIEIRVRGVSGTKYFGVRF